VVSVVEYVVVGPCHTLAVGPLASDSIVNFFAGEAGALHNALNAHFFGGYNIDYQVAFGRSAGFEEDSGFFDDVE
jgi:hypothetical protein